MKHHRLPLASGCEIQEMAAISSGGKARFIFFR
jgi:hypothetical protein